MPHTINRADLPYPDLPEVEGQGGINIDDVSGGKSILLRIGPFNIFTAGDKFDVYWGAGQTLVGTGVISDEEDTYFAFVDLNATLIRDIGNGVHAFFYRFTSAATQIPIDSPLPHPTVRVKLDAPGDPDSSPDPVNPNLIAPTVVPLIIDANQAEKGADVSLPAWLNMDAGDVLTLFWGGETLTFRNLPVGQPVNIHVNKETILAALDNPALPVRYRITDAVGNSSKFSPSTLVNVQASTAFFAKPKVVEAPLGELDLDTLGMADIHVQVDPEQDGINPGDTVHLTWIGTTADGVTLPAYEDSQTVTNGAFMTFTVPNVQAIPLALGSAVIYYEVSGRPSQNRHISVTGKAQPVLPLPVVREAAENNTLDPGSVTDYAHVEISPYPGMAMGDRITYYWKGILNGEPVSFLSDYHDVSESDTVPVKKTLVFNVPKAEVEALNGAVLEIYYTVELYDLGLQPPSPPLTLLVGEGAGQLPPPTVDYVKDGVLDPADAPDGTHVRVTIDKLSRAQTQAFTTVRFFWDGDGGANSFSDAFRFTTGREVACPIEAKYITGNLNKAVVVHYQLEGAGEISKPSDQLSFVIGDKVGPGDAPSFINPPYVIAPGGVLKGIELALTRDGGPVADAEVTLSLPAGFTHPDGSGELSQLTDEAGTTIFGRVKGGVVAGTHVLTASSGGKEATEEVTVSPLAPAGITTFPDYGHNRCSAGSPDGTRLYIGAYGLGSPETGYIRMLDTFTGLVTETKWIGGPINKMVVSPDSNLIYASGYPDDNRLITVVDARTLAVLDVFAKGVRGDSMQLSPDGRKLYTDAGLGVVYCIDIETKAVSVVSLNTDYAFYLALNKQGSMLYITANNMLWEVDTGTMSVTKSAIGKVLHAVMVVSPDGKRLYCCNRTEGQPSPLIVIDTANLSVIKTVQLPSGGYNIAMHPTGSQVYITDARSSPGKTYVVDTASYAVTTLMVEAFPFSLDVSPCGERLYTTTHRAMSRVAIG